jgi:hypothetical protein
MSNARAPGRADPQTAHVDRLESDSEMSVAVTTSVSGTSPQRKLCLTAAQNKWLDTTRRAFLIRAAFMRLEVYLGNLPPGSLVLTCWQSSPALGGMRLW